MHSLIFEKLWIVQIAAMLSTSAIVLSVVTILRSPFWRRGDLGSAHWIGASYEHSISAIRRFYYTRQWRWFFISLCTVVLPALGLIETGIMALIRTDSILSDRLDSVTVGWNISGVTTHLYNSPQLNFSEDVITNSFIKNICRVGSICNSINGTSVGIAGRTERAQALNDLSLTYNTTINATYISSPSFPSLRFHLPGSYFINWNDLPCMRNPATGTRRHCMNESALVSVHSTPKSRFEAYRSNGIRIDMDDKRYDVIGWQTLVEDYTTIFGYDATTDGGDTFVGGSLLVNLDDGQRLLVSFTQEYTIRTSRNTTVTAPPESIMSHLQQAAFMTDAERAAAERTMAGLSNRSGMIKVFTVEVGSVGRRDTMRWAQCEANSNDFRTGGTGGVDDDVETYAHWSRCKKTEMKIHQLKPAFLNNDSNIQKNCTIPTPLKAADLSNAGITCFPFTFNTKPDTAQNPLLDFLNAQSHNFTVTSLIRVTAGADTHSTPFLIDISNMFEGIDSSLNHTYNPSWATTAKQQFMSFADSLATAVDDTTGITISGPAYKVLYVAPAWPVIAIAVIASLLTIAAMYVRFTTPAIYLAHWTECLIAATREKGGMERGRNPGEEVEVDVKVQLLGEHELGSEERFEDRKEARWALLANGEVIQADFDNNPILRETWGGKEKDAKEKLVG
ncbi:hypothetical protein HDV00_011862 [Rhizophlyctis rosea]|nr:hypothetical protein HDV00_011862 [Rhizophlyctis rosea]